MIPYWKGLDNLFFLNKTGFEMFDAFRAYGLAYAISSSSRDADVRIRDYGYAYVVSLDGEMPSTVSPQLFVDSEGWRRVFLTVKERKDAKKPPPKKDLEAIVSSEFKELLKVHTVPSFQPTIGNQVKGGRPLYQSMDVSAAKGFREEKRGQTYHEGSQLYVDRYSWSIACIGGVFFGSPRFGDDFILNLVPNPTDVLLLQHRQIQDDLMKENVCRASASVSLVHYSVKLAKTVARRKASGAVKYDAVVFNVMRKTGQQPKPGGGGKYGLALLERFLDEPGGFDALERIDRIMNAGFVKGIKQELAFAFADLMLHPSLRNLVRCEDLYIRGHVNENVPLWDRGSMEAVLKNVQNA